jgi:hypothetical protein
MNPPPLPPDLPPDLPPLLATRPKRKIPLLGRLAIIIVGLFLALIAFRVIEGVMHPNKNPPQRRPGVAEFTEAAKLTISARRGVGQGNVDEARVLAKELSTRLKIARSELITRTKERDPNLPLTNEEFVVFCQLNEGACAFIVHVPELRRYTSEAKELIAIAAYVSAAEVLNTAKMGQVQKLAVVTRGNMFFDQGWIGSYQLGIEEPLDSAEKLTVTATDVPALVPLFAPSETEAAASSGDQPDA